MAGHGRPWLAMASRGRLRPPKAGQGRPHGLQPLNGAGGGDRFCLSIPQTLLDREGASRTARNGHKTMQKVLRGDLKRLKTGTQEIRNNTIRNPKWPEATSNVPPRATNNPANQITRLAKGRKPFTDGEE